MGDDHPPKHLQLGVDLDNLDEDPVPLPDDADLDALWADATTVEQFAEDLEVLKQLPAEKVDALRRHRNAPGPPPP